MTAKEYLEQIENIDVRIKSLAMQEYRLRNKQGDEKSLKELIGLIKNLRNESIELQKKITAEIYSLKDNRYSVLLAEKYLNGATWEEITLMLGYKDEKYVRTTLHSKALKEFAKLPR